MMVRLGCPVALSICVMRKFQEFLPSNAWNRRGDDKEERIALYFLKLQMYHSIDLHNTVLMLNKYIITSTTVTFREKD